MAFKLRSGNKSPFKNIGSSPVKDMKTGKYEHSFESPAKHTDKVTEGSNLDPKHAAAHNKRHTEGGTHGEIGSKDNKWTESTKSPAKQRKGAEGQDQYKIFNDKGEHVGNYVNDKKVMFTQDAIEDAKGVTSNIKMPKVMKDGPKNTIHTKSGGKVKNWQPHQFKKKKSPAKQTATTWADGTKKSKRQIAEQKIHPSEYWYKINNKPATKVQYVAYKNKPGGDEPGKQTNDPDAMGHKAKHKADRAKLNKKSPAKNYKKGYYGVK